MVWLLRHGFLGYAFDCLVLIILFAFHTVNDYLRDLKNEMRKARKLEKRKARRNEHEKKP